MAEPTDPKNSKDPEHDHAEPHEHEHPDDAEGHEDEEGPPIDPDIRTGFSAEQRRFLWTLTGLNVVAMLLGAAIIVIYMSTARSQDTAALRLEDSFNTAYNHWQQLDGRDQAAIGAMIHYQLEGNDEAVAAVRQQVYDAYVEQAKAKVAERRARGLSAEEPTQDELQAYIDNFNHRFKSNLAMYQAATQPATTQSTQPTTESAAEPASEPATMPAGSKK